MNRTEFNQLGIATHTAVWRLIWVVVACLVIFFFVAALPVRYHVLQIINENADMVAHTLSATDESLLNQYGFTINGYAWFMLVIEILFFVGFVSVAGFIAWRKADDPFALLTALVLLTFSVTVGPTTDALSEQSPFWYVLGVLLQAIGTAGISVLFFLFPDGRFIPRWARWVTVGWLLLMFVWMLLPEFPLNMLHSATWERTPVASMIFAVLFYNLCAFSQIYRYRYEADRVQRQQTKWVVVGFSLGAMAGYIYFSPILFWSYLAGLDMQPLVVNLVRVPLTAVFILCLPITIAIALLRYRLWDVDLIINRTLVYGGLTVVIVSIYTLVVGGLGTILQARGNFGIALLATGLIAVLFQPVRERLQRGINRLMFGERDNPYAVLSQLGQKLQTTATPEAMLQSVTETIANTLKLPYVAIELHGDQGRLAGATTGKAVTETVELPLLYQNETVGYLVVSPRSPGEPFIEREQQLLADMAGQTGAMAYSVRLTAALQQSREKLVLTREEERRRIRRDLHDGLGPTLASQMFALDAALDLLEADPQAAANLLHSLKKQTQETVADVRRLVYELRPPSLDELGVVAALRAHMTHWQTTSGAPMITIKAIPDPMPSLPAAVEVAAYRIALEAVTNVVRHAAARSCIVRLTVEGNGRSWLRIVVQDDGRGLPNNLVVGVGLSSIRERTAELGGTCDIGNGDKGGVKMVARLPFNEGRHE